MKICPFCGKTESIVIGTVQDLPRAWRDHIGECSQLPDKTKCSVDIQMQIPLLVRCCKSQETNHVEYSNTDLGLCYRFYYPEYLDRDTCARKIAESVPAEFAARVRQQQISQFSYEQYQRLNEAYSAMMSGRPSVRIRKWWNRIWSGGVPPVERQ